MTPQPPDVPPAHHGSRPVTPRSLARALVRQARPKQWVKNVLVVAAPGAAGVLLHPHVLLRVVTAFAAFCLVASATYYLNDAVDVEADRRHATKRGRPMASGALPVPLGVAVGVGLGLAGLAVAAVLGWRFLVVVGTYVAVTTAYSLWVKHVPVVELAAVAAGFVVRAIAGGVATGVPFSRWFLIVASFCALFVVAGKRHGEMVHLADVGPGTRASLSAYTVEYLRFVWMVSAGVAITAYCLWAFEQGQQLGASPLWYQLSIVPFTLAVLRYALLLEGGQGSAPEDVLLADRTLVLLGLVWVVVFGAGVYLGR